MKMHAKSLAAAVRGRSRLGAAVGLLFVLLTSSVPASAGDCTVTFYRDTYADGGSSHDHSFSVSSTDAEAVLIPNLYDIKTGSNFEGPGSSMDTWDDRQPERDFTDMISRVGFSGDCSSAVAYLYDHEAYGGLMLEVRPPGVDDLRTVNMHDKATSMRVYFTPQPFCEVCLYTGQNYGGARKKCFDSRKVESVAHANLCTREWQFMESSTVQCFRDDVTSISFEGGACGAVDVWIYDKEDFQGSRAIIERSVANLGYFPRGDDHWNDEVKSFRIGMQGLFDLPRADVASGKYILQAWDGRPVTVQGDGSLIAGGVGTRFGVYNRGNGDHAIQGNSTWLNADANGLHSSAPNGDYTEQHFRLFDVREGVIGIQAKEGRWLFTDENDGGQIHLNPGKVPHWWAFSLVGPLAEVESGKYILQAWDGRPVTVQSDGTLLAGGTGTRFGVYDRGNGEVAIQGGSTWLNAGDYVRVDAPNGDFAEQHFKLIDLGDGTVGIQTSAGEWLFTDEHYGGQLSSNSAKIPHWWTFSLVGPLADVDTGHYTLNDHSGQSVTVQSDGKLFAGGGRGTDFGVYDRGNGEFAIQGGSAWLNAGDHVRVDAPNGDFAEQHFKLIDLGDGTVGIQTSAGEWLFTDEHYGGQLSSNSEQIYHWWRFTLEPRTPGPIDPTAAVRWDNGANYFYNQDQYLRFDVAADQMNAGYPLPMEGNWASWPADFVPTAAVNWGNGVAYFFSEDMRFLRYDIAADQVFAGYPADIVGRWAGWPADFVPSAAVNWGNGVVYFFSEDMRYLRFDVEADQVSGGYPRNIVDQWAGWPADFVPSAAVNWGNGVAYFFNEDQYLRFDIAADQVNAGYPLPIEGNWQGWPIVE